ncbi:PIN domain-containing protein [Klebsiella pneumoniae]|uniref:PIN domain-containing protein n=1 Tax=Klebsiella pneumoniae TaxID=573 RepID=UPI0023D877FE|nr:PIN domain-containing protein [Klebsiella pneumoniae]MCJ5926667.1 PIN domain-containing protein [Klebsiella pneumoniae]MDF0613031.1 PIN domain-containing protein [Klebsiella pneumoniae]MDV2811898.1 PIN domain-containing protein [Klebsiella pneumoniae]MDV2921993.1 PIN domain-containing protein [Klebsiella pneumoniae]MDV2927102.1 PIN domain-containing protein [Klebsiella pneumoniae]
MTKLFIDTNIYLDFYRAASDRLSLFEELKKLRGALIISEQGYKEFQRNRTVQLTKLSAEIERTTSTSIYTTAVVKDMAEHKEAIHLQSQIRKLGQELKMKIGVMLEPKPGDDPVLDAYEDLIKTSPPKPTRKDLIAKAEMRKILGNPPTSPDRHSVCDELLWEELIYYCNEDLIIVSNDKTFTENKKILRDEFSKAHPGKKLEIVKSVSEALNILGKVSERLEATEDEMLFNIKQLTSKTADAIMEIAIRKSSPIILKKDQERVTLKIKNVSLSRENSDKNDLLDAIGELIRMKLIKEVGSDIYELTESGLAYEPFDK